MTNTIKAVIWDMGGVLLREEDPIPREKLAAEYGISVNRLYELVFQSESSKLAGLGEISEEEHWNRVAQTIGIPPDRLGDFQTRFWAGDRVDPQLSDFISGLKGEYRTALLSNAWSGTRKALDEYYGCLDLFHHIIISAEVKLAKPDPAIYCETLQLVEVKPGEAIFVDDLQENVDAANELGIHGIRFHKADQAIADVRKLLNS